MSKKANNQSKGFYAVLTIALVSLAVVALGGVYYYKQADGLREELHNTYTVSYTHLTLPTILRV